MKGINYIFQKKNHSLFFIFSQFFFLKKRKKNPKPHLQWLADHLFTYGAGGNATTPGAFWGGTSHPPKS